MAFTNYKYIPLGTVEMTNIQYQYNSVTSKVKYNIIYEEKIKYNQLFLQFIF